MKSQNTRQYIVILVHSLLWVLLAFVFLFYQPLSFGVRIPPAFWIVQSTHLVLLIALFYVNSLRLVPLYLVKGRITHYAAWCAAAGSLVFGIDIIMDMMFHLKKLFDEALNVHPHLQALNVYPIVTILLVVGISTSIAVIQHLQRETQMMQNRAQQQTITELSLLKSQIHPHFYFNTLNNIYALSFIDVASSRDSLVKLSRMMRYLLYENQEEVSLTREIGFLKDYIHLMRMRLLDNTELRVREPAELQDHPIFPMILVTFVENAFKHGVSATAGGHIHIGWEQHGNRFRFEVENSIIRNRTKEESLRSGIGLANTRRRLELLYPGRYSLKTCETAENNYYILLEMDL